MSYILDALRRADAERDRGAVPGLHAQAAGEGLPDARSESVGRRPSWPALALAAALPLLALLAWQGWRSTGPEGSREPAADAANTAPPRAAPSALRTEPPVGTAASAVPRSLPPLPPPAPVTTVAAAPAPAAPATRARQSATAASAASGASTAPMPTAAATPSAVARLPRLDELPPDLRRQVPSLAIGGSMWSESAASRMLIVNGQLLHEGDRLTPELELEQLQPKSAVFRLGGASGQRFRLELAP